RSRRMLHRGLLRRLVDHRSAHAAVARSAAGAPTLDDGARVRRRRRVTACPARGTAAALNNRALSSRTGRAMRSRDTPVAGDTAAATERRAFLVKDAAVSSRAGARIDAAARSTAGTSVQPAANFTAGPRVQPAASSTGRDADADASPRGTTGSGVAAHARATGQGRGCGLRVTSQPALAAQ
ncbi:hypothetical protein ATCCBAA256_11370, partial [Mycobacterium montefiorense]